MAKILALAGAHRTGKSTLARAIEAERPRQITFLPANLSQKCAELGIKPDRVFTAWERYFLQLHLLKHYIERIQQATEISETPIVVIDRHPLDFLAYTKLNIPRLSTDITPADLASYEADVLELNKKIDVTVIVQPGIPLVSEENKAEMCPVYIDTLNDVIVSYFARLTLDYQGSCGDECVGAILGRGEVDLAKRTAATLSLLDSAIKL